MNYGLIRQSVSPWGCIEIYRGLGFFFDSVSPKREQEGGTYLSECWRKVRSGARWKVQASAGGDEEQEEEEGGCCCCCCCCCSLASRKTSPVQPTKARSSSCSISLSPPLRLVSPLPLYCIVICILFYCTALHCTASYVCIYLCASYRRFASYVCMYCIIYRMYCTVSYRCMYIPYYTRTHAFGA